MHVFFSSSTLSPVHANANASCAVKWQILWKTLVVAWQLAFVTLSKSDHSWLHCISFLGFSEALVPFLVHKKNYSAEQPIVIEPKSLLNVILLDIDWCLRVQATTILTSDTLFDSNKTVCSIIFFLFTIITH